MKNGHDAVRTAVYTKSMNHEGEAMDETGQSKKNGTDWKSVGALIVLIFIAVSTGSLLAGLAVSAVLYSFLRWPWVFLIIFGISALSD